MISGDAAMNEPQVISLWLVKTLFSSSWFYVEHITGNLDNFAYDFSNSHIILYFLGSRMNLEDKAQGSQAEKDTHYAISFLHGIPKPNKWSKQNFKAI